MENRPPLPFWFPDHLDASRREPRLHLLAQRRLDCTNHERLLKLHDPTLRPPTFDTFLGLAQYPGEHNSRDCCRRHLALLPFLPRTVAVRQLEDTAWTSARSPTLDHIAARMLGQWPPIPAPATGLSQQTIAVPEVNAPPRLLSAFKFEDSPVARDRHLGAPTGRNNHVHGLINCELAVYDPATHRFLGFARSMIRRDGQDPNYAPVDEYVPAAWHNPADGTDDTPPSRRFAPPLRLRIRGPSAATSALTPVPECTLVTGASPFSGKTAILASRANRCIRCTTPALGRCHGLAWTLLL